MKLLLLLTFVSISIFGHTQDTVTITHTNYSTKFSKTLKYPVEVEWVLTASRVNCLVKLPRPSYFTPDPQLKDYSDLDRDYIGSGYDRGHNSPNYDNSCDSPEILSESFYYTNVMPQKHSNNAGDWKSLETMCRNQAKLGETIHIWCGGNGVIKTIGEDKVSVPKYLWKVVYNVTKDQYRAYLFNNIDEPQHGPNYHIVDISIIEGLTGFKFK